MQRETLWRRIVIAALPVAWLALVIVLVRVHGHDPFGQSPELRGYGENVPGDLTKALWVSFAEAALLVALLQPWKQKPIWPRALAAFLVFTPWAIYAGYAGIHGGSLDAAHTVWRLALVVLLEIIAMVSGLRALSRFVSAKQKASKQTMES